MNETTNMGEFVEYKGLRICPETGEIFSKIGKELGKGKPKVQILSDAGNKVSLLKLRLVYEAVNGPIPYGSVVVPKDGNPVNSAISNAIYMTRTEYFKNHDWSIKAKANQEEINQIRQEYLNGDSYTIISTRHKMSPSTILKIVKGNYFNDNENHEDLTAGKSIGD